MRVVIVGTGNQGRKRLAAAGKDVVATVDSLAPGATYRQIVQVPLESYDAALVCTPDEAKPNALRFLLAHGKHVLVEKPLLADASQVRQLGELAHAHRAVCYTAYNHRFEPHIVQLRELIESGKLGDIYQARFFYGNGTARDVRHSAWRDQGPGVLADLGSHLLDLVPFLFGRPRSDFVSWGGQRCENRSFDHFRFGTTSAPVLGFEVSLLSWKNTFSIDVLGERGSAHLDGLCKWGPSRLTVRRRVLPSGRPEEETQTLQQPDPTWATEYQHFQDLCRSGGNTIEKDLWINAVLHRLVQPSPGRAAA